MSTQQPDMPFIWPNDKQCAVSLTYDDALAVHYETVAPLLAAKGLTATFNVSAHSKFTENTASWKDVAALGHELEPYAVPPLPSRTEGALWLVGATL